MNAAGKLFCACLTAGMLLGGLDCPVVAQIEVYHPGETYDSLQAGHDAYLDAEALRRAAVSRQLQVQEQIQLDNTWANPADKYLPIRPESFGPIWPQAGPRVGLEEVYALTRPDRRSPGGAPWQVEGRPGPGRRAYQNRMHVPLFEPWPRVPNDIFGAPYYGIVRQPTGYVRIWTGPQSYIYKPTYASPAMDPNPSPPVAARPGQLTGPVAPETAAPRGAGGYPAATIPPPPKPMPRFEPVPPAAPVPLPAPAPKGPRREQLAPAPAPPPPMAQPPTGVEL
ncbi:MAG: hypothetical protein ABSF26_19605 [Thermoguttaceae bacterium]|jgi:hypothetical protein